MILLEPERIDLKISTTGLVASYDESCEARIEVTCQRQEDVASSTYRPVAFVFERVARVSCVSLNFFEAHHGEHEILAPCPAGEEVAFWERTGRHPDPGLYQYLDPDAPDPMMRQYDPQGRLGLRSYLLTGNDSYVEIVAGGYRVEA